MVFHREANGSAATGIPRLGPVGGRIVEEVLVGLIDADTASYRRSQQELRPQKNTQRILYLLLKVACFIRISAFPSPIDLQSILSRTS